MKITRAQYLIVVSLILIITLAFAHISELRERNEALEEYINYVKLGLACDLKEIKEQAEMLDKRYKILADYLEVETERSGEYDAAQ